MIFANNLQDIRFKGIPFKIEDMPMPTEDGINGILN